MPRLDGSSSSEKIRRDIRLAREMGNRLRAERLEKILEGRTQHRRGDVEGFRQTAREVGELAVGITQGKRLAELRGEGARFRPQRAPLSPAAEELVAIGRARFDAAMERTSLGRRDRIVRFVPGRIPTAITESGRIFSPAEVFTVGIPEAVKNIPRGELALTIALTAIPSFGALNKITARAFTRLATDRLVSPVVSNGVEEVARAAETALRRGPLSQEVLVASHGVARAAADRMNRFVRKEIDSFVGLLVRWWDSPLPIRAGTAGGMSHRDMLDYLRAATANAARSRRPRL